MAMDVFTGQISNDSGCDALVSVNQGISHIIPPGDQCEVLQHFIGNEIGHGGNVSLFHERAQCLRRTLVAQIIKLK